MANKLINLFNKVVKNEIAVSNYFNSKRTSSLQNSTINSPAANILIGSGTIGFIGNTTEGTLGNYEVEDRGTEYLVSIDAGYMNGVSWTATDIVIPKASVEGEISSAIYYIYVDSINKTLTLSQITENSTPETTNFVLMVVLVPYTPEGFVKGYSAEENITSFIYGYQANFLYYFLMYSESVTEIVTEIPAAKVVGNLTIEGTTTITNDSESVLLTSDGMYIYDVANVTSLGLTGDYTQSLLATFNKNGLFFYDGVGTVLSKFTKDEATVAGWTINADSLSGSNIIISSTGEIKTADFTEGSFGTTTQIEELTSNGAGEIALTYTVESIISVTVSGEGVPYTFVPQINTLTNLTPNTLHYIEYIKQTTSYGTGWCITSNGDAYFNDVTVFGTLYSTGGNIGGWTINEGYIANGNIVLASSGEIYTANYNHEVSGWKIRWDGFAEFNEVLVRGEVVADRGNIGGWLITPVTIESEGTSGIIMDSTGSIASKNFVIDTSGWKIFGDGTAEFGNIIVRNGSLATTGALDGWTVSDGQLYNSTDIVLDAHNKQIYFNNKASYGSITAGIFMGYDTSDTPAYKVNIGDASNYIKWDGSVLSVTGTISATLGVIGGWTIAPTSISSNSLTLASGTNPYIGFNRTSYADAAGIWLGKDSTAWKASFYANTNNYLKWTGSELLIKAANFELDASGNITASNANLSGTITASAGAIAGWTLSPTAIYKDNIYLKSDKDRFEINVSGTPKLAMGYLDGIGTHLATDFGIYVGASDAIYIENTENGETIQQISGDWLVKDDANILIKSGTNTVLRLGKAGTDRGLFLYDASANILASYTSSGVTINVAGTNMKIGNNVLSSNDGIYINDTNYWYSTGSFKIGSAASYITGSSSGIAIQSSGFSVTTSGSITSTSGTIGGWTIDNGSLYHNTDGVVLDATNYKIYFAGKSTYASTTTGIFMGYDTSAYKINIGSSSKYIKFDGTNLYIAGNVTATDGYIGGWDIGPTTISSGNIILSTAGYIRGNYTAGSAGWSINSAGDAEFNNVVIRATGGMLGSATGWSIQTGLLQDSTATIKLDAANKKISVGSYIALGSNVKTTNYIGLKVTDTNYWETNGTTTKFALGTNLSYTDTSGTGALSVTGTINATAGYIGGSSSGWHIGTNELYYGTSSDVYSIKLDGNNTRIGIHSTANNLPSIRLGYNVVSANLHGLAFYNSSTSLNNYWVWDTNLSKVKFRVGDSINYLDFNLSGSSQLRIVADVFDLSTTGITIDSSTPEIGLNATSYNGASGIWMGNDSGTYKFSINNNDSTQYLRYDGSSISIKSDTFSLFTTGILIDSSVPEIGVGATDYLGKGIWMGEDIARSVYTTMTSNVLPEGQIASSEDGSSTAYYVFNNSTSNYLALNTTTNEWVQIKLPKRKAVDNYRIYTNSSSYCPTAWYLKASNDGINWTTIDYRHDITAWVGYSSVYEISDLYLAPYLYYRLHILSLATENPARIVMLLLNESENYKLSLVSDDLAANYLTWDGHALGIKGDIYLAYGDNKMYFEDSGIMLGDANDRIDDFWGAYRIKSAVFTDMIEGTEYKLLEIMHEISPTTGEPVYLASRLTLFNDFNHASDPSFLSMEITPYAALLRWTVHNTSNEDYPFSSFIGFIRLSDSSTYGCVEFHDPIKVLYGTGKDAASMPNGSILVQGDHLFYRDGNGTWKRAAFYNATPS